MPNRRLVLSAAAAGLAGCTMPPSLSARPAAGSGRSPTLVAYADDTELTHALDRWRSRTQALDGGAQRLRQGSFAQDSLSLAVPAAPAPATALAEKSAAPGAAADTSITNVQTAGVDEGGIVKRAGDHLVILRRGRLFTVRIGGGALAPVAAIDAYGPGIDPAGAWYDELLVSGSMVVVVGYSYARGGTEIGLFDLRPDGGLAHRATWHLRSNDYYASRNYASRLVGSTLVFYSPMVLTAWGAGPWAPSLPGVRRWQDAATPPEFERILPATRIFRTDDEFEPGEPLALHTVTACDLSASRMTCQSTAVLGPPGRVFYMAQGSVYVWTHAPARRVRPQRDGTTAALPAVAERSAVVRIPLANSAAPTAIKTAGVPIDQLSFLEDDGHLAVLLREAGPGEGMWGAERSGGSTALLRVPLSAFGDGKDAAGPQHYRRLPATGGVAHNRFVGDWLLWGGGDRRLYVVRHAGTGDAQAIDAGHRIERIEAMGRDAVAVGNDGADLVVTAVRLAGDAPRTAGRHVQPGMAQGETRTHGFFYRPTSEGEGLLGLPVLGAGGRRSGGVYAGGGGAASVLFLRQRRLDFTALGELAAQPSPGPRDDGCKASCVDWYGNARPIFLDGRVFALLGYELVEGDLVGEGGGRERIVERRRVGFAPQGGRTRDGRYSPFG